MATVASVTDLINQYATNTSGYTFTGKFDTAADLIKLSGEQILPISVATFTGGSGNVNYGSVNMKYNSAYINSCDSGIDEAHSIGNIFNTSISGNGWHTKGPNYLLITFPSPVVINSIKFKAGTQTNKVNVFTLYAYSDPSKAKADVSNTDTTTILTSSAVTDNTLTTRTSLNTTAYTTYKFVFECSLSNSVSICSHIRNLIISGPVSQTTLDALNSKYTSDTIFQSYLDARTAIITFYRDTFVPYRRYLMDSDMMASVTPAIGTTVTNLATAVTAASTYLNFPALGAPTDLAGFTTLTGTTTYTGIRDTYNAATRQFVSALLTRLNTQYRTWRGYLMDAPTTPVNFDNYAKDGGTWSTDNATVTNVATPMTGTGSVASIRDALCGIGTYWPNLVSAMQTFTTQRLTALNHAYTWATTPTTGSSPASAIAENALGTHAATVGLNASVQPLVYTQPVVTASGTTRTFYGIILNTGTATATNVTLLGFEWRVVADPPAVWTNTAATLAAAAAFSKAHTISPVPAIGTQIQVRAYASDTVSSPAITYATAGTNIAYGNIITFTY